MKYSNDKRVSFDSKTHSYFLKGKRLISVTSILNKFKNEFNSDYWSRQIAVREDVTQEEILFRWKEKAFKSTEIGTAIHKIFEDYTLKNYSTLNGNLLFDFMEIREDFLLDFNKKKEVALSFINDYFLSGRIIPIHSEYIVYNDFLAGQIDMICKDKEENYYIFDFKTNEKIEKKSYNKKMLFEFSNIDDASFYHYSLQLSFYKKMLKKYDIKKLYLIHITEDNYKFIECEDLLKDFDINSLINI